MTSDPDRAEGRRGRGVDERRLDRGPERRQPVADPPSQPGSEPEGIATDRNEGAVEPPTAHDLGHRHDLADGQDVRGAGDRPGPGETDPPEVLDLMHRVTLIPTVRRTLFGPRITVFTKDGRSFKKEGTGREFIWDFEEEARRIRPIAPGLAIAEAQFAELIDACRRLDRLDRAGARLISLTIPA